ncbi:hypothetical protein Pd630_LPD07754 [Rhodococcus opacus PD630]|nr:hypothetical protein Pd630_LPD07754 [Rhodococcus opacus PD630]
MSALGRRLEQRLGLAGSRRRRGESVTSMRLDPIAEFGGRSLNVER